MKNYFKLAKVDNNAKVGYSKLWLKGPVKTYIKGKVRIEPEISSNSLLQEIQNYFIPAQQENNIPS